MKSSINIRILSISLLFILLTSCVNSPKEAPSTQHQKTKTSIEQTIMSGDKNSINFNTSKAFSIGDLMNTPSCSKNTATGETTQCITDVAVKNNKPILCEKIQDKQAFYSCHDLVITSHAKTEKDCNLASSDTSRNDCKKIINKTESSGSVSEKVEK